MKVYVLQLKNVKSSLYKRLTLNALLLNAVLLLIFCFSTKATRADIIMAAAGIGILLFFFFLNQFQKFDDTKLKISYLTLFSLLMILWLLLHKLPPAIAQVVFAILSVIAIRNFKVLLDSSKIVYPSFPRRSIGWEELSNVILKDGLLTIDFKNNRIIQEPLQETEPVTNEQEFNEFCREQLAKSTHC